MTTTLSRLLLDVIDLTTKVMAGPAIDRRDEIVPIELAIRDFDDRVIAFDLTDRAAMLMKCLRKRLIEPVGCQRAADWLSIAGALLPMVQADASAALERERRPTP